MSNNSSPTPAGFDGKPSGAVLGRGSWEETNRIGDILRKETVGGMVLIAAALVAIVWANSPWAPTYFAIRDFHIAIPWANMDLSIGHWAADALLAVFFFLTGLELKKEFVAGDLADFSKAIVPVTAAFGGVLVPALIFVAFNMATAGETLRGWAIPTATDIAFAVAVLAVVGSNLPSPLRIFLLTLAVVDDLIAIVIIAFVYTSDLVPLYALLAVVPIAAYFIIAHKARDFCAKNAWASWLILLPLGILAWWCVFQSGIHATIAGVILGFCVPVFRSDGKSENGLAEVFEHRFRPLSTGICVPIFAFFSAGVTVVGGEGGFSAIVSDPVVWGIVIGLVVGKPIGIMGATYLVTKTRHANLSPEVKWGDLFGVTLLAGIGFTVSLLVSELSFGLESAHNDHAKIAILSGSFIAAILGILVLKPRDKRYRLIAEREKVDKDNDGIPDVYQQD
ncbi:NhaA family Na+:H+ antiporter [Neomicrococcus aestuarii]|uniref:Na(+)/H(+) antiporter NhaA n=1 Tax=Neomicrococcus aestuarii TaxID=556325 RepID=A0A7W8TR86_9MICC|nr:Na+/H+ antiporter NhaA [Neomicrococcus aestuarii]MBB5511434.1 NhaA family Na+:H+ antiporter [Neomicrococcus aestuarii]